MAHGSRGAEAGGPRGARAYRGGVPVKAECAEVGHGLLVAVVSGEWGSLGQEARHLVVGTHEQGDDLLHGLLNDVPGLRRNTFF